MAMATGLIGYVLFGLSLIPVEQVPFIAKAVDSWLPYEVLPVLVSLLFAAVGFVLVRGRNTEK